MEKGVAYKFLDRLGLIEKDKIVDLHQPTKPESLAADTQGTVLDAYRELAQTHGTEDKEKDYESLEAAAIDVSPREGIEIFLGPNFLGKHLPNHSLRVNDFIMKDVDSDLLDQAGVDSVKVMKLEPHARWKLHFLHGRDSRALIELFENSYNGVLIDLDLTVQP